MLSVWLTAESENIIQKGWNLVDWIIVKSGVSETPSLWINFAGALLCMIIPYLLGSINPAILLSRTFYREDIRSYGSGNAGSTNVLRTYGKKMAVATLLCDLAKAAVAVWVGRLLWEVNGGALASFFVIFGHMFPIYHGFKGGKGVACLAMVVLLQSWISFLILLAIFMVIAIGTRYVSLASVMSALLYPLILNAFANHGLNVAMAILTAVFVVFMHRGNLRRLRDGCESKLDFSKSSKKKKEQDQDETK